ncbi:alpha/beta fold hydrolase [Pararobbsia silviterrae]|uniref:Alpha/beta fold hydrolase n=2 Tax=Pararobbsia silviterrae TaxID=1792498 RepID=A0A494X8Y8_9BURK|nr:alpha/beta fold hydrolase [Pararobbsia silviterrae]
MPFHVDLDIGTSGVTCVHTSFESRGERCAGTLLLPAGRARPPVIVMAHGFGAPRAAGLLAFAERFVAEGYAAYVFDYRNFGDSDGEPRHWVSPRRHLQDWSAAVAHVRSLSQIDAARIVLWGTSFSGGHVIRTAAFDREIRAVVAQVPHVSGLVSLMRTPIGLSLRMTLAAMRDIVGSVFGKPHYSPIVGQPGELAALTGDDASHGYVRLLPAGMPWDNRMLSRVFLEVPLYSPIRHARRVSAPTLIVAGRRDTITPAHAARRAAQRMRNGEFHLVDGNHFQMHLHDEHAFATNIAIQIDFLRRHLGVELKAATETDPQAHS